MQDYLLSTEAAADAPPCFAKPIALTISACDPSVGVCGDHFVLHEPRDVVLAFGDAGVDEELASLGDDRAGDPPSLAVLICLPSGNRTPFALQKQAQTWMASRRDEHGAPFEVSYRSERVLWRDGRALYVGTGEFVRDVRDAIAYFSLCERQLSELECRMSALWPAISADLELTHSVSRPELGRQGLVDTRTREAHAMRLDFIRLSTALERSDRVLSAASQRIVSELALQADTLDRLRLLDDGIEFAQETYDTANDRLLEYRYFRAE
jgi:hypothetical protein